MVAVVLAAFRPDVVTRVVLLNVSVQASRIGALASVMERVRHPGFFPLTPQFIDEWACHPRPVPEAFLANQRAHLNALPPVVWGQTFGELANADLTPVLALVSQPTLILWGAQDRLADAVQREQLRSGIAGARVVMIDDAAHNPSSAAPERVAAEIADFAAWVDDV